MVEERRSSERGDPYIRQARTQLLADDFTAVERLLSGTPDVDAEARLFGIAALTGIGDALERRRQDSSRDPASNILLALRLLDELPWTALELEPRRDEEQQWADEVEALWRAIDHVQLAHAHQDEWPMAWVAMTVIAGALAYRGAMPIQDFDVCAARAHELAPESLQAVRWQLHVAELRPDTDPVEVAQDLSDRWPAGDPRHGEMVTAHVSRYLEILREESKQAAQQYWRRDEVLRDLLEADDRFGGPTPAPSSADAANLFAFAFPRSSQPHRARRHFDRAGGEILTWPWAVLRSPTQAYKELDRQSRTRGMLSRVFGT